MGWFDRKPKDEGPPPEQFDVKIKLVDGTIYYGMAWTDEELEQAREMVAIGGTVTLSNPPHKVWINGRHVLYLEKCDLAKLQRIADGASSLDR